VCAEVNIQQQQQQARTTAHTAEDDAAWPAQAAAELLVVAWLNVVSLRTFATSPPEYSAG
jgi:hypothetical protein